MNQMMKQPMKQLQWNKIFLTVGRLEGASLLILLFIAMPLKYAFHQPEMVKHVGRAHGGLFLAYVVLAAYLADKDQWGSKKLLLAWVLSCVPFGTFYFERTQND